MNDVLDRLNLSDEPTAYDVEKYKSKVDWSRKCLWVDGKPVVLVSGEFQYWRVPDRSRWRRILMQIKGAGMNAVRLYFHWGYHSPAEDVWIEDGSRDVEYLLTLCEELHLFVIAAPGPYICAETQGGGFPSWLLARREIRIRHLKHHFIKKFDERLAEFQATYMKNILAIVNRHERTTNPNGCVVMLQIENELLQKVPVITFADDEEMRCLARAARESGSTLPFFHNDDMPHGSWSSGKKNHHIKNLWFPSTQQYRTDLYGTDLYFVFAPRDDRADRSSLSIGPFQFGGFAAFLEFFCIGGLGIGGDAMGCLSCLFRSHTSDSTRKPAPEGWHTSLMSNKFDKLEETLVSMGGASQGGPLIAAETQVGWINQWARMRDYDDLYSFFGDYFSSSLHNSLASQGVTIINYYTAYGGTNYGSSGDSEVYTSYDYSAYIREFGMLSLRGRRLRQKSLFHRSFVKYGLAETVRETSLVSCSLSSVLFASRRAGRGDGGDSIKPRYIFVRNFEKSYKLKPVRFTVDFNGIALPCELQYRDSQILPANIQICESMRVHLCTLPVITRGTLAGSELWVIRTTGSSFGRLLLNSTSSNLDALDITWACLDSEKTGELRVSTSDEYAKESQWRAPLEELSQADLEGPTNGGTKADSPLHVRASTEGGIGLCFSVSFSQPCIAVVKDSSGQALMRLIALNDGESNTFTAQPEGDVERYSLSAKPAGFSCAWGANDICLLPDGQISVEASEADEVVYFIANGAQSTPTPEKFKPVSTALAGIIPQMYKMAAATDFKTICPEGKSHLLTLKNWSRRKIDWAKEVEWKPIDYATQRDPLDHLFTSGCTSYRVKFKTSGSHSKVSLTVSLRHVGLVLCDGNFVSGQYCYSHNAISAGAMHGVDITWAGKKRLDLTPYLSTESNSHEVVIVVLSLGQGRQPFLLNDVRNRRGLLSASLSSSAQKPEWEIYGVPVSSLNDPFNTTGLPIETEATGDAVDMTMAPWETIDAESPHTLDIKANDGVQWLRTSFKSPPEGYRFPLDLKMEARGNIVVLAWVNGLFIARYIAEFGPQSDFYVMEGLLEKEKENSLVLVILPLEDTLLHVTLGPWVVDMSSGNLSAEGEPFMLQTLV